ncbi:MAG TPA: carboxypeptidase regulatory-like domain-containing protein, partial [Pyrinomonadaceae bacterium]|nr:carboxypeptidase regulatory-like domain-containing protein [Pyrinomonadaceae bacterium]
MQKFLTICFFSFFILLFGFDQAKACSCKGGANPCGFFRAQSGAAFIGTVTNSVDSNEKYGQPGKARKITIKVEEVFKGTLPDEIITSDDGFRCDNFPFAVGKTYLIYSSGVLANTENIVPVGLCSGTTLAENAQDSINFLRQLKAGKSPSVLYGKLQKPTDHEKRSFEPLPQTKIVLTKLYSIENGLYKTPKKKDRLFTTVTDENGDYKFENLPSAQYKLSAELPNELWMPESGEFFAGETPSCDNYSLIAYTNGKISGKVVSHEGIPVGFLKLRISPTEKNAPSYSDETQTDKDGNYTFNGMSAGKYKISVYLPFYSLDNTKPSPFESSFPFSSYFFGDTFNDSQAQIVNLGFTEKLQNINLKMPAFPVKQKVVGTIVWEDGTPV